MREKGRLKQYKYQAFGLIICSDLELPELMPAEGVPEANIIFGHVSDRIPLPTFRTRNYTASRDRFFFKVDGIGKYYVENGSVIVVEPEPTANPHLLRLYLLGTAMGALLLQRRTLPIHGSAVEINGLCFIFSGISGAGKSTLASALREKGCRLLTDDVAAVKFDEAGLPWVQPGYPLQRLWKDSLEKTGAKAGNVVLMHKKEKYMFRVDDAFFHKQLRLAALCELVPEDVESVHFIELFGSEKLKVVIRNTYRSAFINVFGLMELNFRQCMSVANACRVFRMTRPAGRYTIERQVEIIRQLARDGFSQAL